MDYEKAYKAAKRLAAHWIENGCEATERILLTTIFPELKEIADERIRKALIHIVKGACSEYGIKYREVEITEEMLLAYLEKQKEQKPALYIPKFKVGDKVLSTKNPHLTYNIIEVGLTNERGNPDYRVEIFADGIPGTPELKKEHNIQLIDCQKMDSWGELVEQKPAECIEDSVKFQKGFKAGRESGLCDGQKYVLDNLDSYGLCKPVEWSEEDEVYLEDALWCVKQAGKVAKCENDMGACWSAEKWLKSLRPSPKQEWSEAQPEEKLTDVEIERAMIELTEFKKCATRLANTYGISYKRDIDWHNFCAGVMLYLKKYVSLSSRPKSSDNWKPSEEQMWALRAIINDPNNAGAESCQLAVKSLLHVLKKNGEKD